MSYTRRGFLKTIGSTFAMSALPGGTSTFGKGRLSMATKQTTATLDPVHLLNRATWGICPRDLEKVRGLGADAWLDGQLSPDRLADPTADRGLSDAALKPATMTIAQMQNFIATTSDSGDKIETALVVSRMVRAIYSERQLYERIVEFWTDHFNIPAADRQQYRLIDDRDVIRKHALGNFRDLLLASAQSPAMLFYLNNAENVKDHPNENYAREVMELHTLGVDGGYTERDVREAARALTGWTTTNEDQTIAQFQFDADQHDADAKIILGVKFPAGRGIEDGLQLLDLLATHPATARFIATKLAKRFISETPPETIIASTADVFTKSGGDLRVVLTHLFASAEFAQAKGAKFRRPLEYAVALLRVLDAQVTNYEPLLAAVYQMGHYPFYWSQPNGYPDTAAAWLNSNGILGRWKFAQALCSPSANDDFGVVIAFDKLIPVTLGAETLVRTASALSHPAGLPSGEYTPIFALANGDSALDGENFAERRAAVMAALFATPSFQYY